MPIDTSIYANMLRAPKSIAEYDAEHQAVQQNALAQQQTRQGLMLNQLKADEYNRGVQKQRSVDNALQGLFTQLGPNADPLARARAMQANPLLAEQGVAAEKSVLEMQKTGADVDYKKAQTAKERAGVVDSSLKRYRTALDFIDTPEAAARWMQAQYNDPEIGAYMTQTLGPLDQTLTRLPTDPQGFANWRQQAALGMEKHIDALRQQAALDETGRHNRAGEGIQIRGQDRQSADNAASRAVQMRGQNLADARSRESNDAALSKPFEVTGQDGAQILVQQTKDGRIVPVQGFSPKGGNAKITEAKEAIALLNQAEPLIKGATGSTFGAGVDATAKFFGVATPGSISAQQLKAIEGALVAKMPKMSGPQSDKDVMLYKQMAAEIGDPTVPYERKAAAMGTVREIQERYAGMAPGSSKPAPKAGGPFSDSEKEKRYQEWKRQQGK